MNKTETFKDLGTSATGMILSASLTNWADDIQALVGIIVQVVIMLTTCYVNIHRMIRDKDADLKEKKNKEVK